MRESEKLLKNSNVPVSKVALLSGYQEPSYFMKVFKNTLDVLPASTGTARNKQKHIPERLSHPAGMCFYLTFSFHVLNYSLHTL